jgi:L-ascorbate metabolism protein UlaG (beta-lactamase superfamily)
MVAVSKWLAGAISESPSFDRPLSFGFTDEKKFAGIDKPHVRMTERVIAPERLDFVDVVTSSHNHTDHLDAEPLIPSLNANPDLTILIAR